MGRVRLGMAKAHARAVIVSIGDELVLGQSLDTNSKWLSEELLARGVRPVRHVTVEDEEGAIAGEILRAGGEAELVVVTGGLGPTADDLTRAALALAMGAGLVTDAVALAQLEGWYASRNRRMPEVNRVQALRPAGAECLENLHGTAPGLRGVVGGADVFCLPGPPREMRPMFERFLVPAIVPGVVVRTRLVRTFGLGESRVAELLGELMERGRNPLVGTTAQAGLVTVRMRSEGGARQRDEGGRMKDEPERPSVGAGGAPRGRPRGESEWELDETERVVRGRLGAAVVTPVGGDGELELAEVVVGMLKERGERLAVVESCTGGMVGERVTAVVGSSAVFCGGWITYANAMKVGQVGVPEGYFPEVREGAPGAVSAEVARAMGLGGLQRGLWELGGGVQGEGAQSAPPRRGGGGVEGEGAQSAPPQRTRRGVDHCLAVTGIAGPDGGTAEKPVGMVWICRASADGTVDCRRFMFGGGREAVREWAAVTALGMLRLKLAGLDMALLGEQERRGV